MFGIQSNLCRGLIKRAHKGLMGRAHITFGNKVCRSGSKSRRAWKPNVQMFNLYSQVLERHIPLKISCKVLKQMDRKGGLDAYLLTTSDYSIHSNLGLNLKKEIRIKLCHV